MVSIGAQSHELMATKGSSKTISVCLIGFMSSFAAGVELKVQDRSSIAGHVGFTRKWIRHEDERKEETWRPEKVVQP